MTTTEGLYAGLIPEDVRNSVLAQQHLRQMDPHKRARLEREWLAAESVNDRASIEAERRAIVEASNGR